MANITHIDHIAIAVQSIEAVRDFYEQGLGLKISHIEDLPERGIRTAFINLGASRLELIESLDHSSEIANFLKKRGPGLHHIALNTDDLDKSCLRLQENQAALIYKSPQAGAHNSKINFVHPKSSQGVLVELVSK